MDVAIIGSGPAGTAAALSLKQLLPAASVLIADSGSGRWHPGETLPPGSAEILKSLGCWSSFLKEGFIESVSTEAVWGSAKPYANEFLFSMRGNGWRIDRVRFDAMMREQAATLGVELVSAAVSDSSQEGDWLLSGRGFQCEARFVIDASGRAASFAVQRGARRLTSDRLAAACVLFGFEESSVPRDGSTLVEAQEDGWWYSTIVPSSRAVVAFLSDTDLLRAARLHEMERWESRLAASTVTRLRLERGSAVSAPSIHAAHSQRLSEMGGPRWVAAGEAASAFDPLSSQGILKAMRSGKLASFVAADYLRRGISSQERYEKIHLSEYASYEKAKGEYYRLEQRWPDSPFWKRRHGVAAGVSMGGNEEM